MQENVGLMARTLFFFLVHGSPLGASMQGRVDVLLSSSLAPLVAHASSFETSVFAVVVLASYLLELPIEL